MDPGPRGGGPGAGGSVTGLSAQDQVFFTAAQTRFQEVDSVSGTIEAGVGLGPVFNGNSFNALSTTNQQDILVFLRSL